MLDPHTGEVRPSTKADVAATALMVDYLSDVDVYERAVGAHDVPPAVGQIHNVEAWMANTTKHGFNGPFDGFQLKKIVDMAAAVVGGKDKLRERPLLTFPPCFLFAVGVKLFD